MGCSCCAMNTRRTRQESCWRSGKQRPAPIGSFRTRQKPSMGVRWWPPRAGQSGKRNRPGPWARGEARVGARWRPLRSTTITTAVPGGAKVAILGWLECRHPSAANCGTSLEKTVEVPSWTAPMLRSKTPLGLRLQERERRQASRLRASSRWLCRCVRGRVGRRERGA